MGWRLRSSQVVRKPSGISSQRFAARISQTSLDRLSTRTPIPVCLGWVAERARGGRCEPFTGGETSLMRQESKILLILAPTERAFRRSMVGRA